MRIVAAACALAATALLAVAAEAPSGTPRKLDLDGFLREVEQSNLELAASRFNVPIAAAQLAIAKVRPDPQFTAGIDSYDLTSQNQPTALTYGLSQLVELGGKRSSRVRQAQAGLNLAEAQLRDFFEALRVDATNAFIDALATRKVFAIKRRTLEGVEKLVAATEQRLRAGDVSPATLAQVKVEAERFKSDLIRAEGDVAVADLALAGFLGESLAERDEPIEPDGDLDGAPRSFDVKALVANLEGARTDVLVSIKSEELSHAQVRLARANRWIDPTIAGVLTHAPADNAAGIPRSSTLGFTINIPLPFSHRLHGELDAARATEQQAGVQRAAVKRHAEVDVKQAFARYDASRRAVQLYADGVLGNAERALEAMRYSYEHGAARLIELLDAQRTTDDVYLGYADALSDRAKTLVALERAAGMWDVRF